MSKCILCGNELKAILIPNNDLAIYGPLKIVGYQCPICKTKDEKGNEIALHWTLAEHKDNQNWAVRHIRALEAQVKELSESILVLQKKVLS